MYPEHCFLLPLLAATPFPPLLPLSVSSFGLFSLLSSPPLPFQSIILLWLPFCFIFPVAYFLNFSPGSIFDPLPVLHLHFFVPYFPLFTLHPLHFRFSFPFYYFLSPFFLILLLFSNPYLPPPPLFPPPHCLSFPFPLAPFLSPCSTGYRCFFLYPPPSPPPVTGTAYLWPGAYLGFCQGGCTFLLTYPPPSPRSGSGSRSASASRF